MDPVEQLAIDQGGGKVTPPSDEDTETHYPNLWYFLTKVQWADGTARTLSSILIDRVPGGYKVTLQDHALWLQKRCTVLEWSGVLGGLEKALADPTVPWEPYKSYRVKAPKVSEEVIPKPSQNGRRRVK